MRILVVMQTRVGSSRFANKVLSPLADKPAFIRQAERILQAQTPIDFVVATTTEDRDQPIREWCRQENLCCFSGHPTDLLDRHYQAALLFNPNVVVKIPSDCPLIDPTIIDKVLQYYLEHWEEYDYVSNLHPATYPDGNDVEVMSFAALEMAWNFAAKGYEREHTTPFLWDHPDEFRIGNVIWESGLNYSLSHRFTLDFPEDYALIKAVFEALWSQDNQHFTLADILNLLEACPHLQLINAKYHGVNWYQHHIHELSGG